MQAVKKLRRGVLQIVAVLAVSNCARERPVHFPEASEQRSVNALQPSAGCSDEDLRPRARQVLRGYASFYADSLAGSRTASGVPYDPKRWSAAHRSLPFGTRLRIVRTDLPQAPPICVVVNDRGPYAGKRRIVDLSKRAAQELHMLHSGVVPVRVEVL
jgi:rare lipoprotein A